MIWMDVDIALASVPVNIMPLVDSTDPSVIEDAVVFNQAGLALFWNFTTTAGVTTVTAVTPTSSGDYDWTDFTTSGMYGIEIPASGGASANNDTEGFGHFTGVATGILPFTGPTIGFRAAAVNDALVDSDTMIDNADNQLLYESAITTVTSQLEFIMTVPFAVEDSFIGCTVSLEDVSTGEFYSQGLNGAGLWVSDSTASTESVFINTVFPVTVVAGDKLRIHTAQHPRYALNQYDAATGTEASNILSKLLAYVQLIVRKDAAIATDNSSELTEINADGGSGAGGYVSTSDATQSIRDEIVIAQISNNAIKTKTDQLAFTSGNVKADVVKVAGSTDLQTSGTGGQEYGTS